MFLKHLAAESDRILDHLQGGAQDRDPFFSGNMRQLVLTWWLYPMRVRRFRIGMSVGLIYNCRQGVMLLLIKGIVTI